MCGLAGTINANSQPATPADAALVRAMCDQQSYRGPDDSGVECVGPACLGSVRLSIIDLSHAGHMPMCDASEDWWIAYNGEIYNFEELRAELLGLGHTFKSRTDTEVVLHAFMQWGEACLHRFVGMFAFAIYHKPQNRLHLVRDRYGIKPLYYTQEQDRIRFASEIKALLIERASPRVDKHSLIEWFLYRNVDAVTPQSLVEEIVSVLPGEIVTIADGQTRRDYYYRVDQQVDAKEYRRYTESSADDIVEEFESVLRTATHQRLISDVPVGTLCSGGLDSSLITAMAAQQQRDLTAFNVSVDGYADIDESRYAKQVAELCGIPLVTYSLTGADFRRHLPQAIYLSDFPLSHPNSVAYFLICETARRHGVVVLLSGEGADELFGGYAWRYRRLQQLLALKPLLALLPKSIRMGLSTIGLACMDLNATSIGFRELLPSTVAMVDRYARSTWQATCADAYQFMDRPRQREVLGTMLSDLGDFLIPLLRRLDRTSMGASVEARVPFLDHRLVHKAVNLPLRYRVGMRGDKWILKQIADKYLPRSIVHRKKAAFPLPLADYLAPLASKRAFADGFCAELLQLNQRAIQQIVDDWDKNVPGYFSLLALEIWGRLNFRGESVTRVSEMLGAIENGSAT